VAVEDDSLLAALEKRLAAEASIARRAKLVLEAIEHKRHHGWHET